MSYALDNWKTYSTSIVIDCEDLLDIVELLLEKEKKFYDNIHEGMNEYLDNVMLSWDRQK